MPVTRVPPSCMMRFLASVRHCRKKCVGRVSTGWLKAATRWSEAGLEGCIWPPLVRSMGVGLCAVAFCLELEGRVEKGNRSCGADCPA